MDFSRFTDVSRQTIQKAYQRAREINCGAIEPQILMAVLCEEGQDMVHFLLQRLNVDKAKFVQAIYNSISGIPCENNDHPDISQNLNVILSKANELADATNSSVVALEHIFWAFYCVEGPVSAIMNSFGIIEPKLGNAVATYRNGNINVTRNSNEEDTAKTNLNRFARNLNKEAEEGIIEPSIGRDIEIRHILQIISRKTKNNPLLVGEPGTGKTSIVEGLAHRLIRGDVPLELKNLQIYSLDLTSLMAGASVQGEFEARLKGLIDEVISDKNVILFVDEIHLLVGAGRSAGAMDAANILKPVMARGQIKIIGATTTDEYRKYVEKDKAFERRFQTVDINEPDFESALTILRGIKGSFEAFHKIKILDEALVAAVNLSIRYINDRFLPDKAIDLIDEAASRMRIAHSSVPDELDDLSRMIRCKEMERESIKQDNKVQDLAPLELEIANLREKENTLNAKWQNERARFEEFQRLQQLVSSLNAQYVAAEKSGRYDVALQYRIQLQNAKEQLMLKSGELDSEGTPLLKASLDEEDIRQVVTSWTGIPVNTMSENENEKLVNIEGALRNVVKGQEQAVKAVSKIIRKNRMGFGDANRPIGSFLFLGMTGVGKTEMAKALAEFLFNSRDMMIRIDMSEYQQEHSVARLFGAPPGYVGYEQGGQLTEAVRRKPYSVILLDEIEKANRKIFETLLQVLDDGRMTDGQGHVVNFKNTIIIMTSNLGAENMAADLTVDGVFQDEVTLKKRIEALLKRQTSPEFFNRIDEIVLFDPLSKNIIREIVQLQVQQLVKKMESNDIHLFFTSTAIDVLAEIGYDPTMGARPVKRCINDRILDVLTQDILLGNIAKEEPINIDVQDSKFVFSNLSALS